MSLGGEGASFKPSALRAAAAFPMIGRQGEQFMKPLSITTAWNETAAFVKREAGLLIPIALALVALPAAFAEAMMPQAAAGQQPEAGAWMLLIIPLALLSSIGTLAITILALGRERVVGSALGLAARRVLPLLGAVLLVILAAFIILLPLSVILALAVSGEEAVTALLVLIFMPVFVFLWIRLMLMTPVAAAEPAGPVAILKRSWALTSGRFWRLFGFVLLLVVAFVVLAFAVSAVTGILMTLAAGRPEPGNLSFVVILLVGALLNGVFVLYFATLIARIYAQLAGEAQTSGI